MPGYAYILTIEGIGDPDGGGQTLYCYPEVPSWRDGDTEANAGLAEPPRGISASWDVLKNAVSSGRFTLLLRPYQSGGEGGPINFQLVRPRAATKLAADASVGSSLFEVESESGVSGLAAGSVVYVERETCRVFSVTDGATPLITLTGGRGYAGSTASAHPKGSDVYLTPPSMVGRRATVYEINLDTASSEADEALILQGYLSSDVASGVHWPTFQAVSEFNKATLNAEPIAVACIYLRGEDEATYSRPLLGPDTTPDQRTPRFHASGGYWYSPKLKAVWQAYASETSPGSGEWWWTFDNDPLIAPESGVDVPPSAEGPTTPQPIYQIAWASRNGTYPPFKDSSGDTSEHAIDVALNLLTSTEAGTNGDWDLGPSWAFDCSLGIPIADVDTVSAEALKAQMPDVRASEFWLGGDRSESLTSILERLLSPWGVATGRTMSGQYLFIRLRDAYPGSTSTAITSSDVIEADRLKQYTKGRALDSIVLMADPRPGDREGTPQTIRELGARRWYPHNLGSIVGDRQVIREAPYNSADLGEDSSAWVLIASRIRRLSDRIAYVDISVGPSLFGTIDLGDAVTVSDVAIRDPRTGDRLTDSDALTGLVTSVAPDFSRRTMQLTIAFSDTGKVALISPSATVDSWDAGSYVATCEASDWTASNDVAEFSVGDVCVLLNGGLFTLRSDDGTNYQVTITDIDTGANTITFDTFFRDSGGSSVVVQAGNVIAFAHYDESTTGMQDFGFLGADGARPASPNVGTADDEVYTYGDF